MTCRVGVHYGECIGGIVGYDMQRYHLFGKFMAELEVLQATSIEGGVQVSEACKREVERQLKHDPWLAPGQILFEQRQLEHLLSTKGDVHEFEEVGGPTYLVSCEESLVDADMSRSMSNAYLQSTHAVGVFAKIEKEFHTDSCWMDNYETAEDYGEQVQQMMTKRRTLASLYKSAGGGKGRKSRVSRASKRHTANIFAASREMDAPPSSSRDAGGLGMT